MPGAKGVCLEDYVRFFNKEEQIITWFQLRQILRINGFVERRPCLPKSTVEVALRSVSLTPPGRSTVGESLGKSSALANLSLAEVKNYVNLLGWQECPITSILTVGNESTVDDAAPSSSSLSTDPSLKRRKKSKDSKTRKRRLENVAAVMDGDGRGGSLQ